MADGSKICQHIREGETLNPDVDAEALSLKYFLLGLLYHFFAPRLIIIGYKLSCNTACDAMEMSSWEII